MKKNDGLKTVSLEKIKWMFYEEVFGSKVRLAEVQRARIDRTDVPTHKRQLQDRNNHPITGTAKQGFEGEDNTMMRVWMH